MKEALELASACKRIRGDAKSSGQECGEALDSALRRNLSRRLHSIVLVEEDESSISRQYQARESVITRTPTRLPITSTPSSSPIPPPIPPKRCQYLAPSIPISPESRICSSSGSCSDVSSIQGEVFIDEEVVDHPVPPFEAHLIPRVPVAADSPIPEAMEEAENHILDKTDELLELMASFDAIDVNTETINVYRSKLDTIEELLVATNKEIRKLLRNYSNNGMDVSRAQ